MRRIVFILTIISSVMYGCNSKAANQQKSQKTTQKVTTQNIATWAAKCVNALQNKEKNWDTFNFCETIGQLCKEFDLWEGLPEAEAQMQKEEEQKMAQKMGVDSVEMTMYLIGCTDSLMNSNRSYKDSLIIMAMPVTVSANEEKMAAVGIMILNRQKIIARQYRDAIYEEFRKQGWYSEEQRRWKFNSDNMSLAEHEDPEMGYAIMIMFSDPAIPFSDLQQFFKFF